MTVTIPILLYHSISDRPYEAIQGFEVGPDAFRRQLDRLVTRGFRALTVSALIDALRTPTLLPRRPVVITFDDGWSDFQHAAPALAERGLPSTLYVTTGWLDRPFALSVSQLDEMAAMGVEIGAHSHSHPQLDTLPLDRARSEVAGPRALLEDLLQRPVRSFAYPHGYSSKAVRGLVREAGYTSAASVKNALSSSADDRFDLARLTVRPTTSLDVLDQWLDGKAATIAPYAERLRTRGWRMYRRSRARLQTRPKETLPS
jgi:peptidoglycan/xylan/chitin deacetylase (PgdA/CDA1 family)